MSMLKKIILLISISTLTLSACTQNKPVAPTDTSTTIENSANTTPENINTTPENINTTPENSYTSAEWSVSITEAADLYLMEYPDTVITSIELDKSLGNYVYNVNGVDDSKEYEVNIDAQTKDSKKGFDELLDTEDKNGAKKTQNALDVTLLLQLDEIVFAAEKAVANGTAISFSLEKKLGIQVWDVTVKDGLKEIEVMINAETGEVLEVKKDS